MSDTTILTLQNEEKFCRICHDDQRDLLKVCNCKGSIGLVHMEFHEKWLQFKGSKNCDICGYEFEAPLDDEIILCLVICLTAIAILILLTFAFLLYKSLNWMLINST